MTFWEALPQIADIGGLTLGFLLLVGVFFAILKLVMPAAKFIQDLIGEVTDNYKELLAKAEAINARDLADERADRERLEKRLDQTDEEIGRMNDLLVEKNKQLTSQGEQLTELTKLLNNFQETNVQKDKTIDEMRRALRALENKYAELQEKYAELENQYAEMADERDEWKAKWETAQNDIEVLRTGVEAIQKRDTDKLDAAQVEAEAKDKAA